MHIIHKLRYQSLLMSEALQTKIEDLLPEIFITDFDFLISSIGFHSSQPLRHLVAESETPGGLKATEKVH